MRPIAEMNLSHIGADGAHGTPAEFFGHAIVGFVDILGFSASVDSSWSNSDESPLARLLRIKEAAATIPQHKLIGYTPGEPGHVINGTRVHTVSDSIVVCAALPPTGKLNDLLGAASAVSNAMQVAWVSAIAEGFSVRGAMELGPIFWSEHETIGPGFNHAYWLEDNVVATSRIIAGPRYLSKLLEILKADNVIDDWANWPAAHWLCVSGGKHEPDLIELSAHHLWEQHKRGSAKLAPIVEAAGKNAWRYDRILERLHADEPSPPATIEEIRKGLARIQDLMKRAA